MPAGDRPGHRQGPHRRGDARRGRVPDRAARAAETGAINVAVDLADPGGPARLIETALAELGGVDVLVNNVGGGDGGAVGGFLAFDDARWQEVMELNLFAAVRTTRAAMPSLLERSGSS